jgi:phosphonate transport system ATP-binding protein
VDREVRVAELRFENLSKQFADGTVALSDVSFSIDRGERVVLLGPNGSGKSTLLKCAVRLEEPTSGTVVVGGTEISTAKGRVLRRARRNIAMVFQHFHLVDNVGVFQNVLHGALGRTQSSRCCFPLTSPEEERGRAFDCLKRVGMEQFARRRVGTLSGGQKQRVALARALMQDPELVLADEPVASLDPRAGREVMDLLWEISAERSITVLCTLHQLSLAADYAERIVALRAGQVVLDEPVKGLDPGSFDWLYDSRPAAEVAAGEVHE